MRAAIPLSSGALAASVLALDPSAVGIATLSVAGAVGFGVAFPALGLFGPVQSRIAAPGSVALTFDDGPHPVFTGRVLEQLDRGGHKATFFLIGKNLERFPEHAKSILRRGHCVGLHSYAHSPFNAFFGRRRLEADFEVAERAWLTVFGSRTDLYRPPVGLVNPTVLSVARARGYHVVAWRVRALDGVRLYEPGAIRRRVRRAADGDIILMHDALDGRPDEVPPGVLALPGILSDLEARGLRSVALASST